MSIFDGFQSRPSGAPSGEAAVEPWFCSNFITTNAFWGLSAPSVLGSLWGGSHVPLILLKFQYKTRVLGAFSAVRPGISLGNEPRGLDFAQISLQQTRFGGFLRRLSWALSGEGATDH